MRTQHKDESQRDLVEELIGEECENNFTHRAEGTFEILNGMSILEQGP